MKKADRTQYRRTFTLLVLNADIAYALQKYIHATGDDAFLYEEGAEILVETARLWRDLGFYSARKGGLFCIQGVTGPDEYNTVVHNNTFTNLMARENLRFAAVTVDAMRQHHPHLYADLVHRTGLEDTEIAAWMKAANKMYVPFDEVLRIHPQDDSFLDKEPWDLSRTPAEEFPLLLHHHPLVIYRYRVIKQADIVLAMFLLGQWFSADQKRRNFAFYDPLTTSDSSLSVCIQSILASELGYKEKAIDYGRAALLMDLADIGGNVADGCHIASMGGSWMVLVYGFAGMRDHNGQLSFNPKLPDEMTRLQFPLTFRGQLLHVDLEPARATYLLRQGSELVIVHQGEEVRLRGGHPVSLAMKEL